jgi:hypothetical protein
MPADRPIIFQAFTAKPMTEVEALRALVEVITRESAD